jgi:malate synthase
VGAVEIDNLMEDVATAEISRSQIWQWVHHGVTTAEGTQVTESLIRSLAGEVVAGMDGEGSEAETARKIFEEVALSDDFVDFLTLSAYESIS